MIDDLHSPAIDDLRLWVLEHEVRHRTLPQLAVAPDREILKVGFSVELRGRHHEPPHPPQPGCPACLELDSKLRHIARWAMPREEPLTRFHLVIYQPKLYVDVSGGPSEVVLNVQIVHRNELIAPVDECERRCLRAFRTRLVDLGVGPAK